MPSATTSPSTSLPLDDTPLLCLGPREERRGAHHTRRCRTDSLLWAGSGIIVSGVVMCVILSCFRTRLHFSIAVIQEGCRGLQYNPMLIAVGMVLMTLLIGFFVLWYVPAAWCA